MPLITRSSSTITIVLALFPAPLFGAQAQRTPALERPFPLRNPARGDRAAQPLTLDPLCYADQAVLMASDGTHYDHFGWSASASGDTAVVGAYTDDDLGSNSGSAYVFVRQGPSWSQEAKLLASDGAALDDFGISVAVYRDTAVIGARGDDDNAPTSGSAYVFFRNGSSWSEQAKLAASDGGLNDFFGSSVSIFGGTALVGAVGNGNGSGSVYVFTRSGTSWSEEAKLRASDPSGGDQFGFASSIAGDLAVIGAPRNDDAGADSGSAYVFARSGTTWVQEAKLLASDGAASDRFGWSVGISGESVLVGAMNHDGTGAAYAFTHIGTSWGQVAKLGASDAAVGHGFGISVSISGARAVVGAVGDDDVGYASGSAYVFLRSGSTWSQQAKLLASDGGPDDYFGHSASISDDTVLISSAFHADDLGSGAASAFALPPLPGTVYCTCSAGVCGNSDPDAGCASSTGVGALLTAFGTTSPDEVNLIVSRASPGRSAVFFQADNGISLPFGDGVRCAGGNVVRITTPPISVEADGSAAFGPCFGDPGISSITGVVPGSGVTKRYQFWYRDPTGPCGSSFNLSNGYAIIW